MSSATSMDFEQQAVITTSWHYRYFLWIQRLWGKQDPPARFGLCTYFWRIVFFTAVAVLLSPAIILGWLLLKSWRWTYKGLDRAGAVKTIDFIDASSIGRFADKASNQGMEENPLGALLTTGMLAVMGALVLLACTGTIFTLIYQFIIHIPDIPWALWTALKWCGWAILYVGWAFFHVLYGIGLAIHYTGWALGKCAEGLAWFFTYTPFWSALWSCITKAFIYVLVSLAVGLTAYRFSRTAFAKRLLDKLVFKVNGYGEAKKRAEERRAKIEPVEHARAPRRTFVDKFFTKVFNGFESGVEAFRGLFRHEVRIGDAVTTVLSPLGVAWSMAKSLKRGVCPILEFITPEMLALAQLIEKECEGKDYLVATDERELFSALLEFDNKNPVPTKQHLFNYFLNPQWRKEELLPEYVPVRIKIRIGKYIAGRASLSMTKDGLRKDMEELQQIKQDALEREKLAVIRETTAALKVRLQEKFGKGLTDSVAPDQSMPSATETSLEDAKKPQDGNGEAPEAPL